MLLKEFPLTPTGCRLVQQSLDMADFNVVQQIAILSHCQKCPTCQKYSQELTNLRALLISQVRIQVPNDFDIKLRQKIAASKTAKPISFWGQWVSQPAFGVSLAATVVIGVLVGVSYYRQPSIITIPTSSTTEVSNNVTPITKQPLTNNISDTVNQSPDAEAKRILSERAKVRVPDYVASNENRSLARKARPLNQAPKQLSLDEIDVEIHYGSASRTLPLSAVTYGSRPVLKVDNVSTGENKNSGIAPEAKIF
ncbi:MAG: hypothetical protein HY819_06425 [Acidobacteria bacterium]|nr:hypothetical protein [Acidobacteriota bacterium]